MKLRQRVVTTFALAMAALALTGGAAAAQEVTAPRSIDPSEPEHQVLDRILAVVDEDPILASDVDRVLGLGVFGAQAGEGEVSSEDNEEAALRRSVLDQLIEERLRFHEIDRFGFTEISLADVEKGFLGIRERFPSEQAFRQRLAKLGLDEDGVRQLVARQIMVLTFVEERLGPRIFVGRDEIRAYYDGPLTEQLRASGSSVPSLESVREEVRAVLKEARLNEEIDRWTEELWREADVQDYFDRPLDEMPSKTVFRVD
ncbi:MAG: SurA N-terminal domain-containing protein [Acidobacteriota bacterium]|nr:SurA N-terminal domain-containing protein [Acidobacteriota bacterium]